MSDSGAGSLSAASILHAREEKGEVTAVLAEDSKVLISDNMLPPGASFDDGPYVDIDIYKPYSGSAR